MNCVNCLKGFSNTPELVDVISLDLGFHRGAAGSKAHVLGDPELLLLHDTVDALFVDRETLKR